MSNASPDSLIFNGWLKIHGLPYHLWTEDLFTLIGSLCGGLEEIDRKTKDLSTLSFARIKVRSRGVHAIPRSIPLLERGVWLPPSRSGEDD
uniref:DUF4283 domain-containing protein n=1 Tax=Nelumbo nucifera TaxID=4432 RepID=A0A822XUU0_NELNU|nr:TPA_asm: hypothetical protein HUJ06_024159 [Nelumbo nucifera]